MRSLAEAQASANEAAQLLAMRLAGGERPSAHAGYYPNRPFREQVLNEIKNLSGGVIAVVTRNSYGCQVLNTARVMFVDIDFSETEQAGFFGRLFGKKSASAGESTALAKIQEWSRGHPDWSWLAYRTCAGLRLLATHALLDADSPATDSVFDALGADPLYQRLCQSQKCFRARLTPKPWRCGVPGTPDRWPFSDARTEQRAQKWVKHYDAFAFNWATCRLIEQIGPPVVHPEVQPILSLHDSATRVDSQLRLA